MWDKIWEWPGNEAVNELRFPYNLIGWIINEPQLKTVPSQPFAAATGIRLLQVYYKVASFPGLYKD